MGNAVNLSNWGIIGTHSYYMLNGVADDHPELGANVYLAHTSEILEFKIEGNIVKVKTRSRMYSCPIKFLNIYNCLDHNVGFVIGDMQKIFDYVKYTEMVKDAERENKSFDVTDLDFNKDVISDFLLYDELIKNGQEELKNIEKELEVHLIEEAKKYPNSLYIELQSIGAGSKGGYSFGDNVGIVKPSLHVGMFQDSVLYMRDGILDFRYFPYCGGDAEIYNWSEGLENVVIKNMKKREIIFNGQHIQPEETVVLNKENYTCGLISPDVVTGQSIFIERAKEDE